MKRPSEIAREEMAMATLVELTSAFEGIASMRISQIKDQVLHSTKFFNELWAIYTQLNVDSFGFGGDSSIRRLDKTLNMVITGEGGFSGDIDQKVINLMLDAYDKNTQDIVVVGHHGAIQLAQRGVSFMKYFKLPTSDKNINTVPLIKLVQQYKYTNVFYQEYISLTTQNAKQITLSSAIEQKVDTSSQSKDIISEATYIFEPSSFAVASHLETVMTQITLSQLILESKLAQYASRFRAMSSSRQKATETRSELHLNFNRSRRAVKDERLKEIISGMKKGTAKVNG